MAGIYNGYLLEFPQIRVDCFTRYNENWTIPSSDDPEKLIKPPRAQCYLLSHVHSDHLVGLNAPWSGDIHCTYETKAMLVKLETRNEQELRRTGARETMIKTYDFLKPRPELRTTRAGNGKEEHRRMIVDHLKPHAYNDPFEIDVGLTEKITVVLLDASHCPGSAMFLVKDSKRAILHTGDVRADAPMLYSLRRNPHISRYLPQWAGMPTLDCLTESPGQTLDRIYLDTSAMMGTGDMPDKESAVRGLLELMVMYPEDTIFSINAWTWGWEDVIKGVALTFNSKIHSDRYKHDVLANLPSEPLLNSCLTLDSNSTRFHACGPSKCAGCKTWENGTRMYNADKLVVHVNMVEVQLVAWEAAKRMVQSDILAAKDGKRPFPTNLHCPFARHAPLPELQDLVATFRPRTLSPNTIMPQCKLVDYIVMPKAFDHCLSGGEVQMLKETTIFSDATHGSGYTASVLRSGVQLPERMQAQTQFDWQPEQKATAFSSMPQFVNPLAADRKSNGINQAISLGIGPEAAAQLAHRKDTSKREQADSETPPTEDERIVKKPRIGDAQPPVVDEAQRFFLRNKLAEHASSRVVVKAEAAMAKKLAARRASKQLTPERRTSSLSTKPDFGNDQSGLFIHRPWKDSMASELQWLNGDQPCQSNVAELRRLLDCPIPAGLNFGKSGNLLGTLQNALWLDRCLALAHRLDSCTAPGHTPCARDVGSVCAVVVNELRHMADFEHRMAKSTDKSEQRSIDLPRLRLYPVGNVDRQDVQRQLALCAGLAKTMASAMLVTSSEQSVRTDLLPIILASSDEAIRAKETLLVTTLIRAARLPVAGDRSACHAQEEVCASLLRILHRHLSSKHQSNRSRKAGLDFEVASVKRKSPNTSQKQYTKAVASKRSAPVDTSQLKHLFAMSQTSQSIPGSV